MEFKKKPLLEINPLEKYGVLDQSENKNHIQVICRIRPKFIDESYVNYLIHDQKLSIIESNQENEVQSQKTFQFTDLFDQNSNQGELHEKYVVPMINNLFKKKHNGLVFTYGVTNSGKTYTVIGNQEAPGILPLTLQTLNDIRKAFTMDEPIIKIGEQIINLRDEFNDDEYTYKLSKIDYSFSSLEIYNEEIYDLLTNQRTKLQLKEICDRKWDVKEVIEKTINTDQDCRDYLNKALQNRAMGETTLNSQSSRSHSIFKIQVELTYKANNYQITKKNNICIVDLAGSERSKKAETQGSQLTEACNINKSLLVLGKCLKIMQTESDQIMRIPFRECKLTRLLSEYFTEDNKILMVVNVKLTKEDIEETLKVLHYGALSVNVNLLRSRIYDQTASFCQRIQIDSEIIDENQVSKPKRTPFEIVRRAKMLVQKQTNCMKFQQEIQQIQANQLIDQFNSYRLKLKSLGQKEAGYFNCLQSEQKLQKSLEKIISAKSKQGSLEGDKFREVQPFSTLYEGVLPQGEFINQNSNQYQIKQETEREDMSFTYNTLQQRFSFTSGEHQYPQKISEEKVIQKLEKSTTINDEHEQIDKKNLEQIEEISEDSRLNSNGDNEQLQNEKPTPIFNKNGQSKLQESEVLEIEYKLKQEKQPISPELLLDPLESIQQQEDGYLSQEKDKGKFDQATNTTPFDEMKQKLFSNMFSEDMFKLQEEKEQYKKLIISKLINEEDIQEIIDKENQQQQSNLELSAKLLQQKNLEKLASSTHKSALKIIDESSDEYKKSHENDFKQNKSHKAAPKKKKNKKPKNKKK